eukprot:scaffold8419_cov22-Cyclotella_meneghiniana.AAC.2
MEHVNQELIAVAKMAFEQSFKRTFTNMVGVAPTQVFLEWFNGLFSSYGQASPDDITQNNKAMVADWNPATRDFASVIRQINDAAIFAGFIGQQKSDHDLVYAGELVVRNAGFFASKLETWYKKPQADRIFSNFKTFFTDEISAWYRAGCTTGSQAGYGGNAEAVSEDSYAEAEQAYIDSLRNFSDANANNAKAFDTMANGMMAAINEIKGQLQGLQANAAQAKPPSYAPPPAAPAPPVQVARSSQHHRTHQQSQNTTFSPPPLQVHIPNSHPHANIYYCSLTPKNTPKTLRLALQQSSASQNSITMAPQFMERWKNKSRSEEADRDDDEFWEQQKEEYLQQNPTHALAIAEMEANDDEDD